MISIANVMLSETQNRLDEFGINIEYDKKVKPFLVERGFDPKKGARPLRRAIQEHFEDKLADFMLNEGFKHNVTIKAQVKKDEVVFSFAKKESSKSKLSKKSPSLVAK